ncbi:hypothetical protein [Calothrix sp. CCY 0018]
MLLTQHYEANMYEHLEPLITKLLMGSKIIDVGFPSSAQPTKFKNLH